MISSTAWRIAGGFPATESARKASSCMVRSVRGAGRGRVPQWLHTRSPSKTHATAETCRLRPSPHSRSSHRLSRRWTASDSKPKPATAEIPPITRDQLRILAMRSAIPMVGFGIMDNAVMITAGEAIDSTLGVTLGISTLAAAGLGQCCSDVAGLTSGGLVDAAVSKLRLRHHGLTPEQLDSKLARTVSTLGACAGVVAGCLLGMTVLLGMDTDKVDKARRAKELQSIFESIMDDGHHVVAAERATLFLIDETSGELWSRVASGVEGILKVPRHSGLVGASVSQGALLNVPDAYAHDGFDPSFDRATGFRTVSVLVVPIRSQDTNGDGGEILGAIQMINKRVPVDENPAPGSESSASSESSAPTTIVPFAASDEKVVRLLASHVARFIRVVEG